MTKISLDRIELQEIGLHDNMLQSAFWGKLKSEFGWNALAFRHGCETAESAGSCYLLVLVRELAAGLSLAYIPHGPMTGRFDGTADIKEQWDFAAELAVLLRPHLPGGCMFVRFDPPWGVLGDSSGGTPADYPAEKLSPRNISNPAAKSFRKAAMDIQPPSTVILDLSKTEEELLAGMKSKTRYNIRLAAKKGVTVKITGIEDLPEWYDLYRITAERDKIALHSYDYYERIFNLAAEQSEAESGDEIKKTPALQLLQAVIDGTAEAGIITSRQGARGADCRAIYLYGASSNNKRNHMPSYALQWEAIKQASAAGCTSYDFFGIPPVDNPEHPMYGLYRFKTGFGGNILHRPGCWDFPYHKAAYAAYSAAEKLRYYYYKKLRKK